MKRKWSTKKHTITIRLDEETFKAIEKASTKKKLSRNRIIETALISSLKSLEFADL